MSVLQRNNLVVKGKGTTVMMFAHGFGCDQNMWRYVSPAFEEKYKVVLFDHVGAGGSDMSAYDPARYSSLNGYADDIIDIAREMELTDIILVGHSVSALIGIIAAVKAPELFRSLILVSPSPCYINDDNYTGGFTREGIDELLESLENNHLGWSAAMAPVIMGNKNSKELSDELANSFCKMDPDIARQFARTTFLSDRRDILPQVNIPTLILQCSEDVIAPKEVGWYVHEKIPGSQYVELEATGHCPNLSAPEETIKAIRQFLS